MEYGQPVVGPSPHGQLKAYIPGMLRKQLEIPPEVAKEFVRDLKAYFKASGCSISEHAIGDLYLARFQITSTTSAPGGRIVSVSWSPAIATKRFCSVPFQFGNELPSTLIAMLLSASLTE
jgi:hypothetical protein